MHLSRINRMNQYLQNKNLGYAVRIHMMRTAVNLR